MTWTVAIDWNNDGDFSDTGEDVSARALTVRSQLRIGYGRDIARAGSPIASGEASFELNNASGDYYPENGSSPLAGNLLAARPVRIRKVHDAVTYTPFNGHIDVFDVIPDKNSQSVRVQCLDAIAKLRGVNISTDLYQGIQTGTAIGHILDKVGWSSTARDLDVGATTIRWWWEENTDAYTALERIVHSEGPPALVYVDASGNFVFKDRHHRLTSAASTTSQVTFRGSGTEPVYSSRMYDHGWRNIANVVSFSVDERDPDGELTAVWSSNRSYLIADGQTLPIKAQTSDPFFGAVTPVSGTDYQLRSGTVTVTLSRTQGASATIFVKATGGPAVIDSLQLRAYSVGVRYTTQVTAEESVSIGKYGRRSWPNDAPWAGVNDAEAIADIILAQRAERLMLVAIKVFNRTTSTQTQQLVRTLSDRVTIVDSTASINDDFYIERIEHTVTQGGQLQETTFYCELVPSVPADVFTFDVAGRGFNDGTFGQGGQSDPDNMFRFDVAGQGFNQGLLSY